MNTNQLEYFVAAAETLNFTRAAERCFISQTAMTQQIKALENTVGAPLFIRDKHHVELTPAGRVFYAEARAIVERSSSALRMARMASAGTEGSVRIGYISGFGQEDFAEQLRRFHSLYPNIGISLHRGNMSVLFSMLENGDCDVVFSIAPFGRADTWISHRYLRSYPLMVALSFEHPLAYRDSLTYPDLENEPFIIMQPAGRAKDEAEEAVLVYERGGYLPKIAATEGDHETLLLLVSMGVGISILPEYIIHSYRRRADLRILPLLKKDGSAETLDFEMSWPSANTNPVVKQLVDLTAM